MTLSFAQLEQSEEYKHLKLLERVSLFDTVNVKFQQLGVSATAKAVKVVYDVLAERVKSVTLGSVRPNIADTITEQQKEIQQVPTMTDLERAKAAATAWLTNGKGYKVERLDELGRTIDTLYMDTPDIETAVNIMRVGQSGIGFSHNGVNGPYSSAWTIDGNFVADFITSGKLNAALVDVTNINASNIQSGTLDASKVTVKKLSANSIVSGSISSQDKKTTLNLNTGELTFGGDDGSELSFLDGLFQCTGQYGTAEMKNGALRLKQNGETVVQIMSNVLGSGGIFMFPSGRYLPNAGPYYGFYMVSDELHAWLLDLDDSYQSIIEHKIGFKTINGEKYVVAYD